MDNSDRQEIEDHLKVIDINNHNAIENLNAQIKINKNFNETFTKLKEIIDKDRSLVTQQVNEIFNREKVLDRQLLYTDFALKLKILQDNVEHIQDNIASSRLGLIHSNVLTNEEIVEYDIDIQKLQNIKLGTAIDNKRNIIFVIRIPKEIITSQKSLLIPISNNQKRELMFDPFEIIRYENKIYNYEENKDLKNLKLCNNCLIKKNCIKIFNNASEIIELQEGVIIAKNLNYVNFTSNCDNRKILLKGNYLINFNNCSIKIDNYVLENNKKEFKQSFTLPTFIENIKHLNKKLIFDDIILNQIENINEIKEIKYHKNSFYLYGSITTFIIITIAIIIVILSYKHKNLKIKIKNITQESSHLKEGGVTLPTLTNIKNLEFPANSQFNKYYVD